MRVFILDDNRELAEFLVLVLSENGVEAEMSTTLEEALECFETQRFDGLIVDSTLGSVDGVIAAERIRATKFGKGVPALLMSGFDTALARRIAKNSKCEFIAKPFGLTPFVEQVRALR
jgi:DNA-binding response OmpR family regulator